MREARGSVENRPIIGDPRNVGQWTYAPSAEELAPPPPRPVKLAPAAPYRSAAAEGTPYARAALAREVEIVVRSTHEAPGINETLFRAAARLGSLVAAGALGRGEVECELFAAAVSAAVAAGDREDDRAGRAESARTIARGLDAGENQPRTIPASRSFRRDEDAPVRFRKCS